MEKPVDGTYGRITPTQRRFMERLNRGAFLAVSDGIVALFEGDPELLQPEATKEKSCVRARSVIDFEGGRYLLTLVPANESMFPEANTEATAVDGEVARFMAAAAAE